MKPSSEQSDTGIPGLQPRIRPLNDRPLRESGAEFVLYWCQMNRRAESNQALLAAAETANRLDLPLLYYEGLTCSYPNANDRLHTFILEGVPDTARSLKKLGIGYLFYLRQKRSDPNDILYRLAPRAAAIYTDDYPVFIAARHNASAPPKLDVACFAVDASCVVPMSLIPKREFAAYTIRPKLHRLLPEHLKPPPPLQVKRKFKAALPPFHTEVTPANTPKLVAAAEIDHSVRPSISFRGGSTTAHKNLAHFLQRNLRRYAANRNEPSACATSNLSPYLHFGHISALDVALEAKEFARVHSLVADEFLEELIVRRELGFNFTRHTEDYETLSALPEWAQETMKKHARDKRPALYTPEQLEKAETYDPLWNASQKELLLQGKIHGYYRMYWGKKIIEWSPTYEQALEVMIHQHDRFALDGRDPNTYTNILWCFGLHDRPWPERPVFGKMRYMTAEGMKRKTDSKAYINSIEYMERTGKALCPEQ